MTAGNHEAEQEKPVVTDKRRIDPETGRLRADAGSAQAGPAEAGGQTTAAEAAAGVGVEELTAAKAEALDLADQLARRNADLYNVQQEYNAYVRRSRAEAANHRQAGVEDVVESLLQILDEVELARQHGDLVGPVGAIAEKLETTLGQRFGVTRFGGAGEEFDPEVHEALTHTDDPDAAATTITHVIQPGYRAGEKVLRPARVAVSGPQ